MRFALALLLATSAFAQNDVAYTDAIKKFTTEPRFLTELVDHLPASASIPSPLTFNGYIAGAEGHLTYAADVHRYMRALEAASPRVKVFSIGKSEEGREMIVVAIANEETIASLDRYREITRKLADPRKISDADAKQLVASGKPFYYATGALHSPETGSPEMLMELAYRLAVEDTPYIRAIRDNIITLITPVLEVDGRERQVDLWRYRAANPKLPTPPLVYWGHYVAHDNNRDQIGLSLALGRNVMQAYYDFHPQVMHDLHESVPFLYVSSGTGPFNPALDPIMISEWHRMALENVDEMTRRGLPGVWLHGFWDGWAPNYLFWAGAGRNTIARFYETFGNRWPTTEKRIVRAQSERAWFRPNPALPVVTWSLRNNVNYQQSALLTSLHDMAENRERFLERFWTMGQRAVAKAANEGPAAWVLNADQKRPAQVRALVALLQKQGIEVHAADEAFSMTTNWPPAKPDKKPARPDEKPAKPDEKDDEKDKDKKPAEAVKFAKGSYIVRMDQPYSRLADTLMDVQYVRGEERVYDDTGWTLPYLYNVTAHRVVNPDVLKLKMHPADTLTPLTPNPAPHYPRIALMHTWAATQDEGWWRLALESMNVPYEYISTQDASREANLREKFDVILFPPVGRGTSQEIVNGYAPGAPLPWKKTELTPNLGVDETDDMRPGLGLSGVANLTRFVEDGGLLITSRDTAEWAADYGLARWVRTVDTNKLKAPGTIVQAVIADKKSVIVSGYDDNVPLYYSGSPVFRVGYRDEQTPPDSRPSGRGTKNDPDVPQGRPFVPTPERPKPEPFALPEDAPWNVEAIIPAAEDRPRVIVSFAEKADQLLLSGMLEGGDELAGKPAVILSPRGKGNILLFANNPMWRMNTVGAYPLVVNAILNWDKLR
jgi:hypothetical protein